jgi:hypothetical protein
MMAYDGLNVAISGFSTTKPTSFTVLDAAGTHSSL